MFRNAILSTLDNNEPIINENKFLNRIFSINLNYLKSSNDEYCGKDFNKTSNCIYKRFITDSSQQTINISFAVRQELIWFFSNKNQISKQKSSIEFKYIYLDLFNKAILEIYNLLNTRYCTHFMNKQISNY